jgi:RNA polymerase sigma factor (sigma-70 family)
LDTKHDEQLVRAACQGEAKAIEALLLKHHTDVSRFARTLCATPEDAEDALQETLWIVSRKIGTLKSASALISWLFTIVKRQCYRLLRIRQKEVPLDRIPEPVDEREQGNDRQVLTEEMAIAIQNLPFIYRQVLVMRDVEEITAAEVAATLEITVEAVKSRLHRARNSLRTTLNRSAKLADKGSD